jgi:hypothetical protein
MKGMDCKYMKKLCLVMAAIMLLIIPGCSMPVNGRKKDFPVLPVSVGYLVEKSEVRNEPLDSQTRIKVVNSWGNITLKRWNGSGIKINVTERVKGLRSKSVLNETIGRIGLQVEKKPYTVEIAVKYPEKLPVLVGQGAELEISVPEEIYYIEGEVTTGNILAEGFKKLDDINLTTLSGNININDIAAREYDIHVGTGQLTADSLNGKGRVKVSSGKTALTGISGDLEYKGTSGSAVISGYKGRISCDISTGDIEVKGAQIAAGSTFYATSGSMLIDALSIDKEGSYSFMVSNWEISLYLPQDAGFVMEAETADGYVKSDYLPEGTSGSSTKLPKVLKGTVGKGGPEIILHALSGKIFVRQRDNSDGTKSAE